MTNSNRRYIADPFGRLPTTVREKPFDLSQPFDISKAVGEGAKNGRADVARIETLLGLAVDGRLDPGGPTLQALAGALQSMGRNGDTVLAQAGTAAKCRHDQAEPSQSPSIPGPGGFAQQARSASGGDPKQGHSTADPTEHFPATGQYQEAREGAKK